MADQQQHAARWQHHRQPRPIQPVMSIEDRLWSRVTKTETCWLWTGSLNANGYGEMSVRNRNTRVHRLAYTLVRGEIPAGLQLDHLCRVRNCVNPDHLEPVTNRVNTLRGIGPTAQLARQTHCKRGHEFTPENTYVDRHGYRNCRTCKRTLRKSTKRHGIGRPAERTHCPRGHAYDEENTYIGKNGSRSCRACPRERRRERREAAA